MKVVSDILRLGRQRWVLDLKHKLGAPIWGS